MSEPVIRSAPSSNRLMDALIQVSRAVAEEIIQKARITHTPVILADEHGNILRLDPDEVVKRLEDSEML